MNVLHINTTYGTGSTGKIVSAICCVGKLNGMNSVCAFRGLSGDYNKNNINGENYICVSSKLDNKMHYILSQLTMLKGFFSVLKTVILVRKMDMLNIDVIHIHNLHGSYINIPILFKYIKKKSIPVVMTLHDCFPITGGCSHFVSEDCMKWKSLCNNCPLKNEYSKSILDNSRFSFLMKKRYFNYPSRMIITVPSKWLKEIVDESFLNHYETRVINNGIDLDVFKPTESEIRERYDIKAKFIVLGVASFWNNKKGLDVFIKLAEILPKQYQIILVGIDENIEKLLPDPIIAIQRTKNQTELAEYYSVADVFVNPTREDTFPTVNIEAIACGTPVVTFKTGGSPEIIDDCCGYAVEKDDIDSLLKCINDICINKTINSQSCVNRAQKFGKYNMCQKYIDIYKELLR